MKKHQLAQKIIKILIESDLSIDDQLEVIKNVQDRLQFCKIAGTKCRQMKINYETNNT